MAASAIAEARERFVGDTADHEMTVLRDDGLYRHLRFRQPGTSVYWFDLVTWPGVLAISGDCGCFVFSRTRDMFEFFGGRGSSGGFADARWGINPDYWSEKLRAPAPAAAKRYSPEAYEARVGAWLADELEELDEEADAEKRAALETAVREQLLVDEYGGLPQSRDLAVQQLVNFSHDGHEIYEPWEWDLREYEWSFLWCCWAIVWGIERYYEARPWRAPRPARGAWLDRRIEVACA